MIEHLEIIKCSTIKIMPNQSRRMITRVVGSIWAFCTTIQGLGYSVIGYLGWVSISLKHEF